MLAIAGAALFATSGVVQADVIVDQHGNYVFRDDNVKYGATCVYSGSGSGPYKLAKIVVKAPWLWWMDTDSGNNREHGKVGWELSLQISNNGTSGPWNTLFMSPMQTKTAYEDQPAYDKADAAKLPTMTMYVNGGYKHKPNATARVVHDAFWMGGEGASGQVTHEQWNYKIQLPDNGFDATTEGCRIHYTPI